MHLEPDMRLLERDGAETFGRVQTVMNRLGVNFDLVVEPRTQNGSFSIASGMPALVNFTHPLWVMLWRNLMLDSDVPEEIYRLASLNDTDYLDLLDEKTLYRRSVDTLLDSTIDRDEYEAIRVRLSRLQFAPNSRTYPVLSDGDEEPIELSILKYMMATYCFKQFELTGSGELVSWFREITDRPVSVCLDPDDFKSRFDRYILRLQDLVFTYEPMRIRDWSSMFSRRSVLVFVDMRSETSRESTFQIESMADSLHSASRWSKGCSYAILVDPNLSGRDVFGDKFENRGRGLWTLTDRKFD